MPSVGQILAAERRRQGKSVHDAVEGTKIRSRLLQALEDDEYDRLPPTAYIKGFIQSYARFLEIPSDPLLQQFKAEYENRAKTPRPTDRFLGMSSADLKRLPAETVVPRREQAHAIPWKVWAGVAAGVVLVTLLLCGIGRACTSSPTNPLPRPADETVDTGVTGSPVATMPAEPTTTVAALRSTFKLRVTVRHGQASWVQVTIDGLKAFENTLADGESREWLVTDAATVRAGRPSVVAVARDGKAVRLRSVDGAGVVTLTTSDE